MVRATHQGAQNHIAKFPQTGHQLIPSIELDRIATSKNYIKDYA
jgi:hypothetical protein